MSIKKLKRNSLNRKKHIQRKVEIKKKKQENKAAKDEMNR